MPCIVIVEVTHQARTSFRILVSKKATTWRVMINFYNKIVSQLSHRAKYIHQGKLYQYHTHWRKWFLQVALLEVCGSFLFGRSKRTWPTVVCLCLFCISRGQKTKQMLPVRGNFRFLFVDIWCDGTKCIFIVKSSYWRCWLCFRLFLWLTQK